MVKVTVALQQNLHLAALANAASIMETLRLAELLKSITSRLKESC